MKRLKRIVMVACATFVAVALVLPSVPVEAQSSSSLSVAPRKNYLVEAGDSVQDKITIRNLDRASDLKLSLRVVDFTFLDDGGSPKFFLAADAPQTTWSLKPFLKIPQNVTIPKGGSKSIDISVDIPAGHGAGSYYSAIVYSTSAPDGGNVGLAASTATLVFTQIPGKVKEHLELEKFGLYREATPDRPADYMWLTGDEPQRVGYTLKNNGNVTEAPVGSITIKDIFGNEHVINNVNPNKSLALIGQSRTYVACIKLEPKMVELQDTETKAKTCVSPGLWPGFYTMSLHLYYGQNGNPTQEVTGTASFWYLPAWFIILAIVLLAVIVFLVRKVVLKIREKLSIVDHNKQRHSRK